jgi:perosamine synthetase
MSNINAAIGLSQFKEIEQFIARRREICLRYDQAFIELQDIYPLHIDYNQIAPFTYIVRVPGHRDEFMDFLKEHGVGTGVHYIANHIQPFFQKFVRDELPRTDRLWQEIVTLPLYYEMTDNDVETVINAVKTFKNN